jgi:uncharacterized protein YheU (UPF0270 family)
MGWFKFFIQDKTVQNLLTSFVLRSEQSREKHNNTIDQVDKPITQWVQEALEEAQDLCVYLQKLKEVLDENPGLHKTINK